MRKLFIFLFFPVIVFAQQGKLGKAKEKLKEDPQEKSVKSKRSSSSSSEDSSDLHILEYIATVPVEIWWTVFGPMESRTLNKYPYYKDHLGEYLDFKEDFTKRQNLRLGINYGPGKFNGLQLNAIYKPIPILGVEVDYNRLSERIKDHTERLNITSFMFNYYRIRNEYITLWWGLGCSYLGNDINKNFFSYQIGTEIYVLKPISLHISYRNSSYEHDLSLFKGQFKYHLKNNVFYFAYNRHNIAGQKMSVPSIGFQRYF